MPDDQRSIDRPLLPLRRNNQKPVGGPGRGQGRKVSVVALRTRQVANKLAESGITPLERMSENAEVFHALAVRYENELVALPPDAPRKERERLEHMVKGYRLCLQSVCRDMAVFVHPRLQAHFISRGEHKPMITVHSDEDAGI